MIEIDWAARIKELAAENLRLKQDLKDALELSNLRYKSSQENAWENLRLTERVKRYREALEKIAVFKTGIITPYTAMCISIADQALAESDSEKPVITDFKHSDTCWCTKPGEGDKA